MSMLSFCCAYFLGSLPFGYWIGLLKGVNVYQAGSKNGGATNVYRLLGIFPAICVFLLDAGKGAIVVLGASYLFHNSLYGLFFGAVAILGHTLSPFVRFKGGKGVATMLGVVIAMDWLIACLCFIGWGVILGASRRVSIASILAALLFAVSEWVFRHDWRLNIAYSLIALFVVVKHLPNIKRLLHGEEKPLWGQGSQKVEVRQ